MRGPHGVGLRVLAARAFESPPFVAAAIGGGGRALGNSHLRPTLDAMRLRGAGKARAAADGVRHAASF